MVSCCNYLKITGIPEFAPLKRFTLNKTTESFVAARIKEINRYFTQLQPFLFKNQIISYIFENHMNFHISQFTKNADLTMVNAGFVCFFLLISVGNTYLQYANTKRVLFSLFKNKREFAKNKKTINNVRNNQQYMHACKKKQPVFHKVIVTINRKGFFFSFFLSVGRKGGLKRAIFFVFVSFFCFLFFLFSLDIL